MITHKRSAASFRDPSGFVFEDQGCLFRQVNAPARFDYDHLMDSGLYLELTGRRLLIPHEEEGAIPGGLEHEHAYKVIRPDRIRLITYPYEWSFSQYQDAALLTLEVQRVALGRGMSLKDCSAFNVQFHDGRPIFIDTLSLERYQEGKPWVAYRQFCQHFLAPLALMSLTDVRLNQLCRTNLDGIPLDLANRLLPWRSRLRFGLSLHLHLHGAMQGSDPGPTRTDRPGRFRRAAMLGLIENLESAVRGLSWKAGRSAWAAYYEENSYAAAELDRKGQAVAEFLDLVGPGSVWDLGANTGRFSRLASDRGIPTAAFDFDPACVELNYLTAKTRQDSRLLPLLIDLLNPSPAGGWAGRERASILERGRPELVLALALIHHLAIAGNLPLEEIADFFRRLAPRLVIEFVGPEDSQVQTLMARRSGVHHLYNQVYFEQCFQRHFSIEAVRPIVPQRRILYLMRREDRAPATDG